MLTTNDAAINKLINDFLIKYPVLTVVVKAIETPGRTNDYIDNIPLLGKAL